MSSRLACLPPPILRFGSMRERKDWSWSVRTRIFQRLSVILGPPPKVVWIRLGNCSTEDIARALRERFTDIEEFIEDKDPGFLALG